MKRLILLLLLLLPLFTNAQIITTIAGSGVRGYSGDAGSATAASIAWPGGVAFDKNGNFYFAQEEDGTIRKISQSGVISTVAGIGSSGFSGDNGPATAAGLNDPYGINVDSLANIYIADAANNRIRKVDAITGVITTIVGTGVAGFYGDGGPATSAQLSGPYDVCFDRSGNLFLSDFANNRIRKVNTAGIITTVVGNGMSPSAGDGGPATAAQIWDVTGICTDNIGNLYIADGWSRIRKVDTSGIISTIAGDGTGFTTTGDDGPATAAEISPWKLNFDKVGNLYIACGHTFNVREIDTSGIMHTIAGTGVSGYGGDSGPATAALLDAPSGVVVDACGNVYFSDDVNSRIRKVTYPPVLTVPTISLSGIPSAAIGTLVTVTATVTNAGSSYNIEWYNHGIAFTTTTVPYVTYTKPAGTDTVTAKVVSAATYGCYDSTTSSGFIVTAETTGINLLSSPAITIYPNPTNDLLHIDGVSNTSSPSERSGEVYRILNTIGSSLLQSNLQPGSNTISINTLPPGIYILELTGTDGTRVLKKIVKQ